MRQVPFFPSGGLPDKETALQERSNKMRRNLICEGCGPIGLHGTRIEKRQETYPVKGEDTSILADVRVCSKCGQDVFDKELDGGNLRKAYDIYRAAHGIITAEEIGLLREKYGLSQRGLGNLLGWGEVTIHRYENGSLPDES